MNNIKKLRFGIIGCGRIANRHAQEILKLGILVAVCDIDEEKANDFANKFVTKNYTDLNEMLSDNDIDVIAVCTPNGLHAEHSILALKAGCHVICEKPMAINVEDCDKMMEQAKQSGKELFIVKQNRYNPPVIALKKILEENKLGKIFSIQINCFWNRDKDYYQNSWKGSKELDGGTLFTQFSHFIDLAYWLIGDVKEFAGYVNNFNHEGIIEFEDTGAVILKFENNVIGTLNYSVNSFKKNMEGSFTVFGEKGTVKIGGQYLNELEYQCIDNFEIVDLPKGNPPNEYGTYTGSMSNHDKVYANVLDVLNFAGTVKTNGFEGMKTVEIINKIYNTSK
ncbi:MAG: Gfo/Idh/MocA family oxidoreductase [Bacteroidota bacterium]